MPGEASVWPPEQLLHRPSRLDDIAQKIPGAVAQAAQVIVDNPGQIVLVTAGTIVLTRVALNIVRPRTPLEALALMIVLQIGLPALAGAAVQNGWITFRVRTPDGTLVPLVPGKAETGAAVPPAA